MAAVERRRRDASRCDVGGVMRAAADEPARRMTRGSRAPATLARASLPREPPAELAAHAVGDESDGGGRLPSPVSRAARGKRAWRARRGVCSLACSAAPCHARLSGATGELGRPSLCATSPACAHLLACPPRTHPAHGFAPQARSASTAAGLGTSRARAPTAPRARSALTAAALATSRAAARSASLSRAPARWTAQARIAAPCFRQARRAAHA
jgi:hypothetical protein